MKCKTCKYCTNIIHSHHVTCDYFLKNKNLIIKSPLNSGSVPEYAKENGWFNFPLNFDPIWIENCNIHEDIEDDDILYSFI